MKPKRIVWLPDGSLIKPGMVSYILLDEYQKLEAEYNRLHTILLKGFPTAATLLELKTERDRLRDGINEALGLLHNTCNVEVAVVLARALGK